MDIQFLEDFVHNNMPLTRIMAIEILEATEDKVVVFAPLAPNINHMNNIFGGSASVVAILSAWCLIFTKLTEQGLLGHIVIHKNSMIYEKPMTGGFTAVAQNIEPKAWEKVVNALSRHRMARIVVTSVLEFEGQKMGQFEGEFVVLHDDTNTR